MIIYHRTDPKLPDQGPKWFKMIGFCRNHFQIYQKIPKYTSPMDLDDGILLKASPNRSRNTNLDIQIFFFNDQEGGNVTKSN